MDLTEFAAERPIKLRGNVGMAEYGDDSGLYVKFEMRPKLVGKKSQDAGRPIYEDRPAITIMIPGDKHRVIERFARMHPGPHGPSDPERFPKQWAAFKTQQETTQREGTPLTEWGGINRAHALTLQGLHIHTVEDLARVSDANLDNIGIGALQLRNKAKAFLAASKDSAAATHLQAELDKRDADIAALRAQIEAMGQRKKPGPKPKAKPESEAA